MSPADVAALCAAAFAAGSLDAVVGARLAIRRGSVWVRRVFLVAVGALILRLAWSLR